jgi:DNA-directed RNA polymerase II subunit RPB2
MADAPEAPFAEPPVDLPTKGKDDYPHCLPPRVIFEDGTSLLDNPLPMSDSGLLLQHYLQSEGFGDHHIEAFDSWIFRSAHRNVSGRMLEFPVEDASGERRQVHFENVRIFKPRYTRDGKVVPMTPKLAREQGVTYGSDWYVDLVMYKGGRVIDRRPDVCIGNVPTMLKSRNCILHGRTPRELAMFGEDPKDPGGYFVVSGGEKVVLLQEQLAVNRIFLMDMDGKGAVVARMTANTSRGTSLIEIATDKSSKAIIEMRFPSMRSSKVGERYNSINAMSIYRILSQPYEGEPDTTASSDLNTQKLRTCADPNVIQNMIASFMEPSQVKKSMLKLVRTMVDYLLFPDDMSIIADKMERTTASAEEIKASKSSKIQLTRDDVERIMDSDLFPHLNNMAGPDGETEVMRRNRIKLAKLNLLSIMLARILEYQAGFRKLDDRDSWSNKRVKGAGSMMEQLFRNAWRKALGYVQASINEGKIRELSGVAENIKYSIITDTFHDSFTSANWGVKGTQTKSNVAQSLARESVVATFAHINTVDVGISRTSQQSALRLVQNGQWGFICPVSTPEGENSGLLKNLAITAKVSLDRNDSEIIRLLIGDPEKNLPVRVVENRDPDRNFIDKIMVDGKFLGWCNGDETRTYLIDLRRTCHLPHDMTVVKEGDWVYVDISSARLVRPLLIVDADQQLAIDRVSAETGIDLRRASINDLLSYGVMEYLSPWEQEYVKLAVSTEDISKRLDKIKQVEDDLATALTNQQSVTAGQQVIAEDSSEPLTAEEAEKRVVLAREAVKNMEKNRAYTHCEIDSQAILGVAAALIPWPNHNPAPRNTYQVSMGKQALGVYHANHLNRYDGKTKLLAFSTRPIVETEMYDIIGLDEHGPGENISMAFMAIPGNEEDSFVVKKEFLDNGGFRMVKYLTYTATFNEASGEVIERLAKPDPYPGERPERYDSIHGKEAGQSMVGLPKIGAFLKQGDCVIGKIQDIIRKSPDNTVGREQKNASSFMYVGDQGIVDKVLVTTDNKTTTVTVKLRTERIPQGGDKFAPRNAQKGTIGVVKMAIDMPCDENGITPDFIVNSHAMPSRMTISYPMEMLASKHAAMRGVHINGGAFHPFNMNDYRQTMVDYGMEEFGYENMRSGSSGKPLQAKINMGPCFWQALKHHAIDKIQSRGTGDVHPMTRQPPKGRRFKGGLRFGEMEQSSLISHGASSTMRERLMFVSDGYQTVFCKRCGTFAVNDPGSETGYRQCRLCQDTTSFGTVTIPYVYKLLKNLLAAIGINLRPEFMTSQEYMAKIFQQLGEKGATVDDIQQGLMEADQGLEDEQNEDAAVQEEAEDLGELYNDTD